MTRSYLPRLCESCGESFQPTSGMHYVCLVCVPHLMAKRLYRRYGITWPQFKALWKKQRGRCGICRIKLVLKNPPGTRGWAVDHDHSCCVIRVGNGKFKRACGKCVRGILCYTCNRNLVGLESDDWVSKALTYLEAHLGNASE